MEARCGGLFFTSKFDSGNLAKVEKVEREDEDGIAPISINGEPRPDYEFNVWTKPDCAETEFENPNRTFEIVTKFCRDEEVFSETSQGRIYDMRMTPSNQSDRFLIVRIVSKSWFYFGVKGYSPNRLLKINIQNLNRQGKLYGQGYSPFVRVVGMRPGKWERIRDKATFEMVDTQFILSFTYRFPDQRGSTVQFSFCYPWSYEETQQRLAELDAKFEHCAETNAESKESSIYYHRELLCYSLTNLRMDLITVSDCRGITDKNEPRFDNKLFPDKSNKRCRRFLEKRVYVLTSRVHPGETPGSHVFNGFLEFILREDDPRARALRHHFVFKLIPILNPDGVLHGHYRTDTRGVNLNRVYLDPDPSLYPTIYAAKSVLVYYHVHYRVRKTDSDDQESPREKDHNEAKNASDSSLESHSEKKDYTSKHMTWNVVRKESGEVAVEEVYGSYSGDSVNNGRPLRRKSDSKSDPALTETERTGSKNFQSNFSRFDIEFDGKLKFFPKKKSPRTELIFDVESSDSATDTRDVKSLAGLRTAQEKSTSSHDDDEDDEFADATEHLGNEGSDDEGEGAPDMSGGCRTPHLSDPQLLEIPATHSGVAFYVDLHGHASKRGCFIYGNYLDNEEQMVDCLLYPKLISMNTAHFDFGGCNFSLKNMYTKDKRDGMTKEGSGRVAIYKAIGIVRSYTLECNYNMGRMVNCVPPASGDDGRATPPPLAGFPPKYTIAHYEEVGRACAVAALDLIESNPWSRVSTSEFYSLHGVREFVRRYYRSFKGSPAKGNRVMPRLPVQRPPVSQTSVGGGKRLSVDSSTATASTASLNGRRPPGARRDSNPTQRRDSLQTGTSRTQSLNQRRASDTDQRSPVKRPAHRVTTPPRPAHRVGTPPQGGRLVQRKEPVMISFSKRDGKTETPANSNGFRPNVADFRRDRRQTLPACPPRSSPERVPPTPPSVPPAVPPTPPALAEFTDLQAVKSDTSRPGERYAHLKLFADDGAPGGLKRQGTATAPASSCQQNIIEEEEKKIRQLKDLCAGGMAKSRHGNQILLNKNLEPPKSDPLKRKVVRRVPSKRRSNSHSPKSAKGGRSWTSSGTDSEAERRKTNKKRKNFKRLLKEETEERESESRSGLQSVGITGIKLSPRPTLHTEITMQQVHQFFVTDKRPDQLSSSHANPDSLQTGLTQLTLLNRRTSHEKLPPTPRWADPSPPERLPPTPPRWTDPSA